MGLLATVAPQPASAVAETKPVRYGGELTLRRDGRRTDELRPIRMTRNFTSQPEGSVLIQMGNTMVLCTASVSDRLPQWLQGSGSGWVTAEYDMLPRATAERTQRAAVTGRRPGRTLEIQRLIGRSLRAVTDLQALGEINITLDCDVLQADGGTRTAAVTGAFIALVDALAFLKDQNGWRGLPVTDYVAAVSVGLHQGVPWLDLDQREDSAADVDLNVVATGDGRLVEVQGTAEGNPFSRKELDAMLALAQQGIQQIIQYQRSVWAPWGPSSPAGRAGVPLTKS